MLFMCMLRHSRHQAPEMTEKEFAAFQEEEQAWLKEMKAKGGIKLISMDRVSGPDNKNIYAVVEVERNEDIWEFAHFYPGTLRGVGYGWEITPLFGPDECF